MPSLEITTMVGCPLMCSFCPQDKLKAAYTGQKYMELSHFKTILSTVPDYVRIDFSGMAEPWSNPSCTDMLRHTLERGYKVAIYSTLYGVDLKEAERIVALLKKHNEQVVIVVLHLPDENGNMRGWRDSAEYRPVVALFMDEFNLQQWVPFWMMTMSGDGEVDPQIRETVGRELHDWTGLTRAGNLDVKAIGKQPVEATPNHTRVVSCSMTPFYDQNVVMPNGDVVLCCMDYGQKHIIGNLLKGDYWSLFSSKAMSKVRVENQKCGNAGTSLCKSCSRAKPWGLEPANFLEWL